METKTSKAVEIHNLTNAHRTAIGLKPLSLDMELTKAAQWHSEEMAKGDFMGHRDLKGRYPMQRVKELTKYGSTWIGENVAAGYVTSEEVHRGWLNSPGHKKNIEGDWQDIGVGYFYLSREDDKGDFNYNHYYCVVFGKKV